MTKFRCEYGKWIIDCKPFAQTVLDNQKAIFCDYCLRRYLELYDSLGNYYLLSYSYSD